MQDQAAMIREQTDGRSPFHVGERQVQERLGVRDIEHWARNVVRNDLPPEHRAFYASLPFLIVAARDDEGRPWATLLTGPDGFVTSPDSGSLAIHAKPPRGDGLETALTPGVDLGILGIEFSTRRRNRVNGRIFENGTNAIVIDVDQSFGNCPQYIRERQWRREPDASPGTPRRRKHLTPSQIGWIASSDTFFIASGYRGAGESAAFGMDASHRGGERGFVRVTDDARLEFPDYAGNNHMNTIGNLELDPRAGLLFVDFETGSLLQLTGRVRIDWEPDASARAVGVQRVISLEIDEIVELPGAVPLRWEADAASVRSLRLIDKIRESDDVTSFVFGARDGGPLPAFQAGQHLPIELNVPGLEHPIRRTYSLSGPPSVDRYRISVKRQPHGVASRYLHDHVEPGAILDARKPAGEFVIPCDKCPVALISGGVGLTPLVSLLHALSAEEGDRPVWFIHGARDRLHHPMAEEVRDLTARRANIRAHVAYSRPGAADRLGEDYHSEGRIDGALLARLIKRHDAHYFVCGPVSFMADIQTALERQGIPAERIHSESFGPAGGQATVNEGPGTSEARPS